MSNHHYYYTERTARNYGCFSLLLDAFLTIITSGLWIIWIIIREFRRR